MRYISKEKKRVFFRGIAFKKSTAVYNKELEQKKEESYKLLTEKGFIRLCDNVRVPESMGPNLYFEDWWINPKYFSKEFIENNTFEMKLGSYIVSNIKTVNEK